MTTFDERERGYEAKFARDEELRFKAAARRDKLLGAWAAEKLGLEGADAELYSTELMRADLVDPSHADPVKKVVSDLNGRGVAVSENEVRAISFEFMARAVADIEAGR
jgi:hypothetical protein